MKNEQGLDAISELLVGKSALKQDIYAVNLEVFTRFKVAAEKIIKDLTARVSPKDSRIRLIFEPKSDFEFHLHIAGDVLVFLMHSNVFQIEPSHVLWQTSYLRQDSSRAFCGILNIYNFLHDSFRFNRLNDVGYLLARLFVNKERHYFIQGKVNQGIRHNDFINEIIDDEEVQHIMERVISYTLGFDLYAPPYDSVFEISVEEIISISQAHQLRTGKRLGYRFGIENTE